MSACQVTLRTLCYGLTFFLSQCAWAAYVPAQTAPPKAQREYRAAWIATVSNIDWPSSRNLTPEQQRSELIAIMDQAVALKLNTLIFQVRPGCDAMYESSIEPWSEYLTGAMGKAPSPNYDPLRFAVEEAHKRGLELHAWFNPYRARHDSARSPVSDNHISKTKPALVKKYGGALWLDPGEKEVQEYSLSVVMDVLRRYDVDGIHFDDYFYPYKVRAPQGGELDFPDDESWKKSGMAGKMSRDDWRRQNVDRFIERVYKSIKAQKPWVKFGISPFGIWRPGHPSQIRGFDPYEKLYADARKWLQNGWCDYFAPQLYWAIDPPEQSFPVLLKWWTQQNKLGRCVVPGLNSTQVPRRWKPDEIANQITLAGKQQGASGHIHWNMRSLMRSADLRDRLLKDVYSSPALPPQTPWLSSRTPESPSLTLTADQGKGLAVQCKLTGAEQPALWLAQYSVGGKWKSRVLPGSTRSFELDVSPDVLAVSALDRYGALSKPTVRKKQ